METEDSVPSDTPSDITPAPAATEVLHLDQYSEYLLRTPREIVAVLRQVVTQGDLVTIYFNSGKDFLLTTLLAVNDREILLDRGSNREMNERAQYAEKLFCITRHDKVKLQFILTGVREARYEDRMVFVASLPPTLLRLQRREYYRLSTPIMRPLICQIPALSADGSIGHYPHNVIDISIGGLSMQLAELPVEAEQVFNDCVLELPLIGVITATLKVRNIYEITLRNGQRSHRAGCQFIDLPIAEQNLIQRYIVSMERERKARESGLA